MEKNKIRTHVTVRKSRRQSEASWKKKGVALTCLMAMIILTAGCADIRLRAGRLPDINALETSLKVGQSTREDVVKVLGEPFGKGKEMLPIGLKPRSLWSYYYEEGSLQDDRRMFLYVFLDEDKYDGYMWFSSLKK